MNDLDDRLTALLAVPDRTPDARFFSEAAWRLAADRSRTATLLAATVAMAVGLWLFAHGDGLLATTQALGGGNGTSLTTVAALMLLWLGTAGSGALASD